jgi:hypothetical protein
VRHDAKEDTDDLKKVILIRVEPDQEGDRERRWWMDQRPAKAERSEMPVRMFTSKTGYHRCHGEETWARNHETEVGAGSLCMEC